MMTRTDWARVAGDLMMLSMKVDDYDDSVKMDVYGRRRISLGLWASSH